MKIDIIISERLHGLYINGRCVKEAPMLELSDVLSAIGADYQIHTADQDWMDLRGSMPDFIDNAKSHLKPSD